MTTNRELKQYWKYPCPKSRFIFAQTAEGNYQVIDTKYGLCLSFGDGKLWQQIKGAWFAKNYVRIHGDINFNSFPYGLFDEPCWDGLPDK